MPNVQTLKLLRLWMRFREALHRYSGLISFAGTALALVTFICSDIFWQNQKDYVASLEATRDFWFLGQSIDAVQSSLDTVLYKLHGLEIYDLGVIDSPEKIKKLIGDTKNDLSCTDQTIKSITDTYQLLYNKLAAANPKIEADQSVASCQAKLADLHKQESDLYAQEDLSSNAAAIAFEAKVTDFSHNYWKESKNLATATQKVLNSFNSEYSSANGLLDFFSYNRYLFYSLGFLIGILGQVAGAKPADAK